MGKPSPKQKVLLMGRSGAGKSSMRRIIFSNLPPSASRSLGATIAIDRTDHKFLGNLELGLWDCGGQGGYMRGYLDDKSGGGRREEVFSGVGVCVYVFDVESRGLYVPERKRRRERRPKPKREQDTGGRRTNRKGALDEEPGHSDTSSTYASEEEEEEEGGNDESDYSVPDLLSGPGGEDLRTFSEVVTALREYSPSAHIFALVHKMDLVANSLRESVFLDREAAIRRVVSHVHLQQPPSPASTKAKKYPPPSSKPATSSTSTATEQNLRLTVLPTSIWDPSLYLAWGKLTSLLLPHLPLLESYLHHLSRSVPRCEELLLFEAATWLNVLTITTPSGAQNPEPGRSERISAVVRGFRKGGALSPDADGDSSSPASSSPPHPGDGTDDMRMGSTGLQKGNFTSLQLKTPKFNLRIGRLTDNSYVMIVFGAGEGEMGSAGVDLGVGRSVIEEVEGSAARRREREKRRK